MAEMIDHPSHYGGADNLYEHVKVAEAWGLLTNAFLYNCTKYICRAGKKDRPGTGASLAVQSRESAIEDLKKARWYLDREIARLEKS